MTTSNLRKSNLASKQTKLTGASVMGMFAVLEQFVVALAVAEAPTRSDPAAFIRKLRKDAIEGANRFGNQEAATAAENYADEIVEEIVRESGVDMGDKK